MFNSLFGSKPGKANKPGPSALAPDLQYRRILVPLDMRHADQSEGALATAAALARLAKAQLHVLTVAYPFGDGIQDVAEAHQQEFEAYVAEQSKTLGVAMDPVFRVHDTAVDIIADVAAELETDLIVMVSHDPRFADRFFGSNASHVVTSAKASVLVVR